MGNQPSNKTDKLKIDINAKNICSLPAPVIQQQRSQSDTLSTISSKTGHHHHHTSFTVPLPTLTARLSTPHPITSETALLSSSCSYPETPTFKSNHRRSISLYNINNGITGTHISSQICEIAAFFWEKNIESLPMKEQLEIGCAIFFGASSSNKEMKYIMNKNNKNIERTGLKCLDMIRWLLQYLMKDNVDLYSLLTRLGIFHQKMGVNINHFDPLLKSMHETLSYYFPQKYNVEVKYAMDEIFSLAAQIMTGQELKYSAHLNDITKTFEKENDIDFLKELQKCLKSTIGREYLYRYLRQTLCDEIVLFLQTLFKFKSQINAIQRFIIARDIVKTSIKSDATFTLNLSYDCRNHMLHSMQILEQQYQSKQKLDINADFFHLVEQEIYQLILNNHWKHFADDIKLLQSTSFGF